MGPVDGQARLRFDTVALIAVVDSIAPIGYLVQGDALGVEVLAIIVKLLLLFGVGGRIKYTRIDVFFVSVILSCLLIGSIKDLMSGTFSFEASARYCVFALSISLTLAMVDFEAMGRYCRWLVVVPTGAAALQIAMSLSGLIQYASGRYFYVGNTHPNLGGEIAAMAAIAAAIGYKGVRYVAPTSILLASTILMQSRSAIVVIAGTLMISATRYIWRRGGLVWVCAGVGLAAAAGLIFSQEVQDLTNYVLNGVLLADDVNRGFDTGFTGREGRWLLAFQAFASSPLIGIGIGTYWIGLAPSPHDAFLYGLAQHGVVSLLLWLPLGYAMARVAMRRPFIALVLACGLVLLVANDRFINLNLYPFAFYVLILRAPRGMQGVQDGRSKRTERLQALASGASPKQW
jgi:hypothetical protein